MFNSNGLLLKKSDLIGNITSIQVNDLPKGNYILSIETGNYIESQKSLFNKKLVWKNQ